MVECPQRRRWFPPSHHGTDHEAHDEYLHCDPGFLGDMSGGVGPFMFCEPVLKLPLLHPHSLTLRHRPYDYEEIGNNDDDLVVVHRQTWICDGCGLERYHSGVYHCTECAFFDLCIGCSGQVRKTNERDGCVFEATSFVRSFFISSSYRRRIKSIYPASLSPPTFRRIGISSSKRVSLRAKEARIMSLRLW